MKRNDLPKNEWTQRLVSARKAGVLFAFLKVTQSLLAVFLALVMRNVINSAVAGSGLMKWGLTLAAVSVLIPCLGGVNTAIAQRITDRIAAELRRDLLIKIKHKDYETLNAYHSGAIFDRMMTDVRVLIEKYTHILPDAVGQAFQLVAAIVMLLYLHAKVALIVLICGVCVAVCGVVLRKLLKPRYRAARKAEEELISGLQENLEQEELLRTVADEQELTRRFDSRQTRWVFARRSLRRYTVGGVTIFSLMIQIGMAALILWGALAIRGGVLTYGDLTAMIELVTLFRAPVSGLTGVQAQLAAADTAKERIAMLKELPEEATVEEIPPDAVCKALVFKNLSFSYDDEQPIFDGLSARIPCGEWTCLSGASGRGKSTLFRLLLGIYRPRDGEVYVETDRGNFPCSAATRRFFGFVPQSPVLFSGTVRENMLLGRPDADDAAVWRALDRAQCGFLRDLPQGLDTPLGQFGEGLSVGQRQRITIARTLLTDAPFLLLDEITSSLDGKTAKALLQTLRVDCPSALLATHRPDTLDDIAHQTLNIQQ